MLHDLFILAVVGLMLLAQSYFKKKGENLATREDIAGITNEVKKVEHQYQILIEEFKAKKELRFAALDKRLQTHQEAFSLWRKMLSGEDKMVDGRSLVLICQDWFNDNCLYLEPKARDAFLMAYFALQRLAEFKRVGRSNGEEMHNPWRDISAAGNVILEAVKLPALSDDDIEKLKP